MKKLMLTIMFAFTSVALFAQIPVTFQVNMGYQIRHSLWATTDSVVIRGDFQYDAGDTANKGGWAGYHFLMQPRSSGDSVYILAVNMPDSDAAKTFNYKFVEVINGADNWESRSNRTFVVTSPSVTLPVVNFNDQKDTTVATVKNTVEIKVDMSSYLGTNPGQFDPSKDSLVVVGLSNWDSPPSWSVDQSTFTGNRTLQQDLIDPTLFTTTLSFYGPVGDSVEWKIKAYPDANFGNGGGYETGSNRAYHFVSDTINTQIIGPIVPTLVIYSGYTSADQNITFNVYMGNAVDYHNKLAIDPTKINFVGLKGGVPAIGNWAGSWTVSDTVDGPTYVDTISTFKVLHKVSADVWSITQKFPAGTPAGSFEFKFGCDYPGVDTVNSGSTYLDNEMGFGVNHVWTLQLNPPSTPTVLNFIFGTQDSVGQLPTGIKKADNLLPKTFSLSQNYPNPFNPSTIIRYSVPKAQVVTIKVYNMLGQEVATLLNNMQNPGNYEVNFNANNLASGVYFYTLSAGNFKSVKKMMLLK